MQGCLIIIAQDLRELWGNRQALSITPFDEYVATSWLNRFLGKLDLAGMKDNN